MGPTAATRQFLYRHPHPAVAVDVAVFSLRDLALHVLLIERGREPYRGAWALPGGFVRIEESLDEAARRELREETGLDCVALDQIGAFGDPRRDPRERVISIAYLAVVQMDTVALCAGTDAARARWWPSESLPPLAFDHAEILSRARNRLRDTVAVTPLAAKFLPEIFTLSELQASYEALAGETLDKRNFRKWALSRGFLRATGAVRAGDQHRPPALYRVRSTGVREEPSSK
ncbi:MAG: NUDIX hydrolase [Gammaproteobacteria bacterium]|nr:NUDIX hydrolase [Gammaproteobacteria bacterium]